MEEENDCLECQIAKEKLKRISSSVTLAAEKPDYSLDAVVGKLRKQKVEFRWVCLQRVSQYDGMPKEGFFSQSISISVLSQAQFV